MAMEIFTVGRGQEGYPERLMPFADMPSRLFVRGALPADEQKTAAIVGARMCTAYGKSQAAFFAQVLAANGVAVISGLACGIDAAAHEGVLRGKGKTFAVLGCGVDICYPKQNYPLMRRMLENGGGVLSEFPPGAEPLPWHFPIRNRVISALADVVLVIEAKEKSGSLITADYALEQGKTVFALPGRTTDATSRGCNRLIAQGAEIAISPETILEELGVKKAGTKRAAPRPRYGKEAEMVLKTLAAEPQNLAQLAGSTGIPLQELTGILLALEIDGVIAENCIEIVYDSKRCEKYAIKDGDVILSIHHPAVDLGRHIDRFAAHIRLIGCAAEDDPGRAGELRRALFQPLAHSLLELRVRRKFAQVARRQLLGRRVVLDVAGLRII